MVDIDVLISSYLKEEELAWAIGKRLPVVVL